LLDENSKKRGEAIATIFAIIELNTEKIYKNAFKN
tara:strand:- start:1622 stop:1726 length:105 start_codon:yes stop_codon:yes gene_type:complete